MGPFTTITVEHYQQLMRVVRAARKRLEAWTPDTYRELEEALAALKEIE